MTAEANGGGGFRPLAIFSRLTRGEFIDAWRGIRALARSFAGKNRSPESYEDRETLKALVAECIHAKGGDVSARSRTVELGTIYLDLSVGGRELFHDILARDFDIARDLLAEKIRSLEEAEGEEARIKAEIALRGALDPPRLRLLKQFSALPNGFKFLIDMRAAILPKIRQDSRLYKLSGELKEILSSWFDVSLLDLHEITWNSPAAVLEKLIEYEAVHEIGSWDELRSRLDSDRLCFAFFHHKMPWEPLIFVEVALVETMSGNIQEVLGAPEREPAPEKATTAIFYSISNTQAGLAGISLGNFLIKTVVERLSAERPYLRRFATLSPVPDFRKWLDPLLRAEDEHLLDPSEHEDIIERCSCDNAVAWLRETLAGDWRSDRGTVELLRPILVRLCARYLLREKRGAKALDPVANFHLTNGASLERINWLADVSENGMERSYGIMVNYHYILGDIERNHEEYVTRGEIAARGQVRALLKD